MRTYGETKNCAGCRFWSEMIAMASGGGPVKAMCLTEEGPLKGKYTSGGQTCSGWKSGHHGAIDDPPNYGEEVRSLYEAEEAQTEKRRSMDMALGELALERKPEGGIQ